MRREPERKACTVLNQQLGPMPPWESERGTEQLQACRNTSVFSTLVLMGDARIGYWVAGLKVGEKCA